MCHDNGMVRRHRCRCAAQEEDVIGLMPSGDKIADLKPLGDRVLIKVRVWIAVAERHSFAT